MTVAYWVVAALLASLYLYSGGLKVLRSPDQLRPMMGWIDTVPLRLVRTIGVLEVLGALGLILPPLTGVAPVLALAAAIGLVLIQVGEVSLHLSRGEVKVVGLNVVLLVLALIIWIVRLVARFTMRSNLEEHFNGPEPVGLSLSGVMTFFFGGIYFQYHLNRINELKRMARYRGAAI